MNIDDLKKMVEKCKRETRPAAIFLDESTFQAMKIGTLTPLEVKRKGIEKSVLDHCYRSFGIPVYLTPFESGILWSPEAPAERKPLDPVRIERPAWPALLVAALLIVVAAFMAIAANPG